MEWTPWLSGNSLVDWNETDIGWLFITVVLSTVVGAGYAAHMFNWYFQSKMRAKDARTSLVRLAMILTACGICGAFIASSDMKWAVWRAYDCTLLCLAIYIWWTAFHSRGMGLVTERLSHMDELERTCARYTEIAELLPQMVWTATASGEIDYMNQRWREYAGGNHTWRDAVSDEERADVLEWWNETVHRSHPAKREIRLNGTRGYRTFLVTATPVIKGDAVKWLGACADIEDQKLLAAEKEKQAKQKAFFLNSLSHDLRTPLNNVVLNAQLLKMISNDEEIIRNATTIVESALAASNLMSQLLDFARSGSEIRNDLTEVSLLSLLRQIERRFSSVVAQKQLYLRVIDNTESVIVTDRMKLERVIGNLVDNAIKFTTHGGISLGLSISEGHVSILVTDTGPGVPVTHAEHLFDEFYQVNNIERDRRKGFGLGLAICKQLAQQIDGGVRLASTGPEGSCFEVFIRIPDHARGTRPLNPWLPPESEHALIAPVVPSAPSCMAMSQ